MQKYIIFQAESGEDEGWRERKLQHSQALTFIIAENWDSSNEPIPEPGYRPVEFVRVESEHDPRNTHTILTIASAIGKLCGCKHTRLTFQLR